MDIKIRDQFVELWEKYFGEARLPIAFYYTDEDIEGETIVAPKVTPPNFVCFLGQLRKAFDGKDVIFNENSFGCPGGASYTGFKQIKMPNFEYFLSCGIEGKMEGERYKRTPELALEYIKTVPKMEAGGKNLVFKRWDKLTEKDNPEAVIFFSTPDVLSAIFTLDNFEESEPSSIISPFVSGCGSIITYPRVEALKDKPKSIMGMFDVSARPSVFPNTLSFAIPYKKFEKIIDGMEESFLITPSWAKVQKRLKKDD